MYYKHQQFYSDIFIYLIISLKLIINALCLHYIQRVALIRTLATHPNLILLDEPFSALDFQSRLLLTDDVYKIIKEKNISSIIITHNIEEAVSIADRIIVLSDRPSIIKNIYKTNFNNLPSLNRKEENFNQLCTQIWKDIDIHV